LLSVLVSQGYDAVFQRLSQDLSLLTELHLTIGIEGYDSMDLSRISMLSKLIVDNCEYVQLDRLVLPKRLKSLSLLAWYGLKEHYVLAELMQDSSSPSNVDRLKHCTERSQASKTTGLHIGQVWTRPLCNLWNPS